MTQLSGALRAIRGFLYRLFWIERLDGLARERNTFVFNGLRWIARFFMWFYVVMGSKSLYEALAPPSVESLLSLAAILILFPLAYRLVMWVQIKFHRALG